MENSESHFSICTDLNTLMHAWVRMDYGELFHKLALFSGPAQLSIACIWGEPEDGGYLTFISQRQVKVQ